MPVHHQDNRVTLLHGDCLHELRALPDASVDSVVTDPPYGLEFMGKGWDGADGFRRSLNPADAGRDNAFGRASRTSPEYRAGHLFQEWCESWAVECLRVLKPGGHLLAFGGTRTWHRLACAIEDAGFEMRDSIAWLYGSGFPKSLDVSKAIDKAAGATREAVGVNPYSARRPRPDATAVYDKRPSRPNGRFAEHNHSLTAPATDDAATWQGWGTALKPGHEPIVVARKPLTGTVAANVLTHGTGALNIDGCRIHTSDDLNGGAYRKDPTCSPASTAANSATTSASASDTPTPNRTGPDSTPTPTTPAGLDPNRTGRHDGAESWRYVEGGAGEYVAPAGRWPANVALDETQAAELDRQSGNRPGNKGLTGTHGGGRSGGVMGEHQERTYDFAGYADTGGASRFFYVAKAPTRERPKVDGVAHPTVKPLTLMRWLVRLVTPPGGVVLEPFAGSGTTIEAALLEGFQCIAIERDADYLPLILARIQRVTTGTGAGAAETSPPTDPPGVEPVPDLGPTIDDKLADHVAGQLDIFGNEATA